VIPDSSRLSSAIRDYFKGYPFQIKKSPSEISPGAEEALKRARSGVKKSKRLNYAPSAVDASSNAISRRKSVSFVDCEVVGFSPALSAKIVMESNNRRFTMWLTEASIPLDLDPDPAYTAEQLIADYLLHWVAERIVHMTIEELDGRTLGLT